MHIYVASQMTQDKTKLWHLKLEHISENSMIELREYNLLGYDKLESLEFSDHYILGKSYRLKFETDKHVSKTYRLKNN